MQNWFESIREATFKIKARIAHPRSDIAITLVVILVGSAAFGLGRLSAFEESRPAIRGFQASQTAGTPMVAGGYVVASRKGGKYHFPWCSGAKTMKEENKIWFDSVEEARAAGYAPAGNCKGLK